MSAGADPRELLDGLCETVREALLAGETRLELTLTRTWTRPDGLAEPEFAIVYGFRCGDVECPAPDGVHVRVYAGALQYGYPDHLEHRGGA